MPQLDFSSYPSQLFWLAISFALLYFLFAKIALPKLTQIQSQRHKETIGKRQKATQAAERAEQILTLYEERIAEGRANAQREGQKLRAQTNEALSSQSEEAKQALAAETLAAESEIAQFSSQNRAQMIEAATQAAQAIIEKLTGVAIAENIVSDAVERADR